MLSAAGHRPVAVEMIREDIDAGAPTNPDGTILESVIEIEESLGHALDLVINGGPVSLRPSSVVSLIDDSPEIVREGQGDVSAF
ncbi:MAG: Sua5/YciO/YrdC/YwlC family protein [Deltaproteobacteria bacterium]